MTRGRHIVVIGASSSGVRAAEALRRNGHDGPLTMVGAEEELPYDRPPLSKQILLGTWEPERAQVRSSAQLTGLDIALRLGTRAIGLDARARLVRLSTGESLGFDALIIACGAEPRRLPWQRPGIHELRSLGDSIALRDAFAGRPRIAIVGAGFIGGEVASAARACGLEVTVIEQQGHPCESTLGPAIGGLLADVYASHGVDLRCGAAVVRLEGAQRAERVVLSTGDVIDADLVVAGVGVRPATDWLVESDVKLADGVVCDRYCATTVPGVYACGDIARWPDPRFGELTRVEHWTNAVDQARCVAHNLLRPDARRAFDSVPYFWSDQFGLKLQSAGDLRGATDSRFVREYSVEGDFLAVFGCEGRVKGAFGIDCPTAVGLVRREIAKGTPWDEAIAACESRYAQETPVAEERRA